MTFCLRLFSCFRGRRTSVSATTEPEPTAMVKIIEKSPSITGEYTDTTDYYPITYKDTQPWIPPIKQGKVVKVYDGDTITIACRIYESSPLWRFSVRLRGIDTPEMKGPVAGRVRAMEAQAALERLIFMKMVKLKNVATEKYGRVLADVYLDDLHVNQYMLDYGFAVPYNGGKKKEWNFAEETAD